MANMKITIPGEMRGKGRPKFTTRGGFARAYTDAKTASAETWVKACAIEQVGQPLLDGPLSVAIAVGVSIPPSWPKKRQASALAGALRPTGKPDFDNIAKLICDALNKIVWVDDSQITEVSFSKSYSAVPQTILIVEKAPQ
jgi:Holliday junction resolvase RusA-like endonuclease